MPPKKPETRPRVISVVIAQKLRKQGRAATKAALALEQGSTQDEALNAGITLERQADRLENSESLTTSVGVVLRIADDASDEVLNVSRVTEAVQRGDAFYLPICAESQVPLPDLFVRSALFSSGKTHEIVEREKVPALGSKKKSDKASQKVALRYTGTLLRQFDRRVYAALITYYRRRPLAINNDDYVEVSIYSFASVLMHAYSPKLNFYIRSSLQRLGSARLSMSINETEQPVKALLNATVSGGNEDCKECLDKGGLSSIEVGKAKGAARNKIINNALKSFGLSGKDVIKFQIPASLACLYGHKQWGRVSRRVLAGHTDLDGWLCGFYGSHDVPHWLPLKALQELSGWDSSDGYGFRRNLKLALMRLSEKDIAPEVRLNPPCFFGNSSTEVTPSYDGTGTIYDEMNDRVFVRCIRWKNEHVADD
jgi:hypothetical protein